MARPVRSLLVLVREVDGIAPNRDKSADGWIGDAAHAGRSSDHNADPDGTVDARDITHDPAHGCDVDVIFARIIARRDPRVSYLIRAGRICAGRKGPQPWVWRARNKGPDDHVRHGHISVLDEGQDDESPWLIGGATPRTGFGGLAMDEILRSIEALKATVDQVLGVVARVDRETDPLAAVAGIDVKLDNLARRLGRIEDRLAALES